jgi:hypothetical protein
MRKECDQNSSMQEKKKMIIYPKACQGVIRSSCLSITRHALITNHLECIAEVVIMRHATNNNNIYIKVWGCRLCDFLTTLYDIIFWWWSYTCNSDTNLWWTWKFEKFVESATVDHNVMEWWVLALPMFPQASPNGLTWCLTQHYGQGLDNSIVHNNLG